jgi:hypothetical protein
MKRLIPLALLLAACGSSAKSTTTPTSQTTAGVLPPAVNELAQAEHPTAAQFPAARRRTLQQVANNARATAMFGPATGVYTPGIRRIAFGLNAGSGAFIYAPTAVYIARTLNSPARGPFLAPADPMTVAPQYRSRQNMGPAGIQAIYAATVPLPNAGSYSLVALTKTPSGYLASGGAGVIAVAKSSPIPNVGQRPPAIATDTSGPYLTTRVPPESMHAVSFKDALGKKPIALLISTPQLCRSRVCGPVTDIAVELQQQFGSRIDFIHQEVYVDNQLNRGFRPQFKAFHLQSEPWLFTINRKGVITARLEGSFGVGEFRRALEAALR